MDIGNTVTVRYQLKRGNYAVDCNNRTNNVDITINASNSNLTEDDFGKCATSDLIDIANKEIMRVLIVSKPRCGKTTLAKQLEKRLNLVRVAADQWIDNLFKKIKDREENPPEEEPVPELEEGQEPPPKKSWL